MACCLGDGGGGLFGDYSLAGSGLSRSRGSRNERKTSNTHLADFVSLWSN